jgi:hypothetical protein
MAYTIHGDDPRSIKAIEIAAGASSWLTCYLKNGQLAYGIPSESRSGRYYIVTSDTCDCADFQGRNPRRADAGRRSMLEVCKHVLAFRLHLELGKPHARFQGRQGLILIKPPAQGDTTERNELGHGDD